MLMSKDATAVFTQSPQPQETMIGGILSVLRQEDAKASCCTEDEGRFLGAALSEELDGATVINDPILGGILSSKRDFFLVKNQTQLSIRTR